MGLIIFLIVGFTLGYLLGVRDRTNKELDNEFKKLQDYNTGYEHGYKTGYRHGLKEPKELYHEP